MYLSEQQPQANHVPLCMQQLRSNCRGLLPLDARWEDWMATLLTERSDDLHAAVKQFGSPLNIVSPAPFLRNSQRLVTAAHRQGLDLQVYFARKANKCIAFVDAALKAGMGLDVASEQECRQALLRGAAGEDLFCTAAIKSPELIQLCVDERVTICLDNLDELRAVQAASAEANREVRVAIRASGFRHEGHILHSRFGFDVQEVANVSTSLQQSGVGRVLLVGLHFHLDGYCANQRISAIRQSLTLIDTLWRQGHCIEFLDIGGGLPMSYLEDEAQWNAFWAAHREALLGLREPITYRNHGLGLTAMGDDIVGRRAVYPYFQSPTSEAWLTAILTAADNEGRSLAAAIRERKLALRCEPGRSVLDGGGITAARVEFCKRHVSGEYFVGLAMNHTQCRTSSADFLVDPIVLRAETHSGNPPPAPREGYLVGAYCTESELLMLRKLQFPRGIAAGDLVIFPNTAGYLMHFLESRSHQFPLAHNVVYEAHGSDSLQLDEISSFAERPTADRPPTA